MDALLKRKLNFILSVIANKMMKEFQGDILIDHQTIIERLEEKGEIELYISPQHFDTEVRFQYPKSDGTERTVEEARQNEREHQWGDYRLLIKIDGDSLRCWVEKKPNTELRFPIEDMEIYANFVKYDIINQYGKEQKKE